MFLQRKCTTVIQIWLKNDSNKNTLKRWINPTLYYRRKVNRDWYIEQIQMHIRILLENSLMPLLLTDIVDLPMIWCIPLWYFRYCNFDTYFKFLTTFFVEKDGQKFVSPSLLSKLKLIRWGFYKLSLPSDNIYNTLLV